MPPSNLNSNAQSGHQTWRSQPVPPIRFGHSSLISQLKESDQHWKLKKKWIHCGYIGKRDKEIQQTPKSVSGALKCDLSLNDGPRTWPSKQSTSKSGPTHHSPITVWASVSSCKMSNKLLELCEISFWETSSLWLVPSPSPSRLPGNIWGPLFQLSDSLGGTRVSLEYPHVCQAAYSYFKEQSWLLCLIPCSADVEPPVIDWCRSPPPIQVLEKEHAASWDEPQFSDNSGEDAQTLLSAG